MCFLIQQKACIKMQIEIKEIIMIVTIILTALMVGALIGYFFFIESHIGDKCEKCHKRKVFPKSSIKIGTRDIMRDSVTKKTTKDKRKIKLLRFITDKFQIKSMNTKMNMFVMHVVTLR